MVPHPCYIYISVEFGWKNPSMVPHLPFFRPHVYIFPPIFRLTFPSFCIGPVLQGCDLKPKKKQTIKIDNYIKIMVIFIVKFITKRTTSSAYSFPRKIFLYFSQSCVNKEPQIDTKCRSMRQLGLSALFLFLPLSLGAADGVWNSQPSRQTDRLLLQVAASGL